MTSCQHTEVVFGRVMIPRFDEDGYELPPVEGDGLYERSTLRDINAGTYRCDLCGFTGYY